jgi:hypothetical protein
MSGILVDETRWPIITVTTIGSCSDEEFEGYLSQMTQSLRRKTRVAVIIDTTQASHTPSHQRKRQAEWMREHKEVLTLYSAGMVFVSKSAVLRFVLSSIFLIQSPPCDYSVTSSLLAAAEWVHWRLCLASR